MVDIIDEIKEDIKEERVANLWKNYGHYIIICAIAIVIGTAGKVWWNHRTVTEQQRLGKEYYAALKQMEAGDFDKAMPALEKLSHGGTKGYSAVSYLMLAGNLAESGNIEGAEKQYKACIADEKGDTALRELCRVFLVSQSLEQGPGDEKEFIGHLNKLNEASNPWYYTGRELKAAYALKKEAWKEAYDIFHAISTDDAAPASLKNQAHEMSEAIREQHPEVSPDTSTDKEPSHA